MDRAMEPVQPSQHVRVPALTSDIAIPAVALEHIYISSGHDYWFKRDSQSPIHGSQDLVEVECVAGRGLRGDRYFDGKPDQPGQVTFFEAEVVDAVRDHFKCPDLSATAFRRNLIVRGVCLRKLMGRRFAFQGITFEGAQECKPCVWMDRAVAMGAQSYMRDDFRGGLRARVCTTGLLRVSSLCESFPITFLS